MPETTTPSAAALRAARAWLDRKPLGMHKDDVTELALIIDRETGLPRLAGELSDAADALDQITDWMERIALPALGEESYGGHILCEGNRRRGERT